MTETALDQIVTSLFTLRRKLNDPAGFHLGFTGSRRGPTDDQYDAWKLLCFKPQEIPHTERWRERRDPERRFPEPLIFHNGAAVGADQYAFAASPAAWRTFFHPVSADGVDWIARYTAAGKDPSAGKDPFTVIAPLQEPLVRNRHIVLQSEALVAMPDGPERIRSGTWATVRYARKQGLPILIIHPDGHMTWDGALRRHPIP